LAESAMREEQKHKPQPQLQKEERSHTGSSSEFTETKKPQFLFWTPAQTRNQPDA
jgi:hypothetical protein